MVVVKVRETYDLKTVENKMTVIGIHTPKPDIIKRSYPGLLMQCKAYRPVSCDVRLACASVLPLDPLGVGTEAGDVAPEDVFNPILYKAMSNKGMSQLEARINALSLTRASDVDVDGHTAFVDVDTVTDQADEFNIYYGLLANTHEWRHANAQNGLEMSNLRPFVYEMVYNVGDIDAMTGASGIAPQYEAPGQNGSHDPIPVYGIIGKAKEMPFINTTSYSYTFTSKEGEEPDPKAVSGYAQSGFPSPVPANCELDVPYIHTVVGAIIVPPSRLHALYFRMVVEWNIEFSSIRPISEITNWGGLAAVGNSTHYQNYSYESTKKALTGSSDTILSNDSCMVSTNAEVNKVM